jgi:hypothetical protein
VKKNYSISFYLVIFFAAAIILKFLGFILLSWTDLFAYFSMLWGISMFYYSFLTQNQSGIFIGATLFQIGIILISMSLFEIYNPAQVFIPALITTIGISLLFTYWIGKKTKQGMVLSVIFILVGVLLMILRGNLTITLYFESIFQLLKELWFIIIILLLVIYLTILDFRNNNKNQS